VLEIGIGTGSNVRHYHDVQSVAAIDPDGASLQYAKAKQNGSSTTFRLYQARAEELPFPDEWFDSVIATLVFCTVGDPLVGLSEVFRVLKKGGAFRMVEHVRADQRIIANVQDAMTPMWKVVADGCHLNRNTVESVEHAGFRVKRVQKRFAGIFVGIDAVK
jgi:ubiquinone/menaquinone biosynthesis C-methylase UbiE